jgi:endoglucanase
MKKYFVMIIFLILIFFIYGKLNYAQNAIEKKSTEIHKWWRERFPDFPAENPDAKKLLLIEVNGNRFVNSKGDTMLFRGLSIGDPDKIENEGHWNKDFFIRIKNLGTMLIRIPVHPVAWRERTPEKYLKLLDQAVQWCTELGMYIDIDWHSIGNLQYGLFQDPMYNTSVRETFNFWRIIAGHFTGNNTVAFYELFNEPTSFFGKLGPISWDYWKKTNEDLIQLIRAYDQETIPLVAGFDWAYDLTPLNIAPINAERIGYVTHPYPNKRSRPWPPKWEEDFGFAASKYPLIATEIGFTIRSNEEKNEYGKEIITFLESKGISWLWWVFDPEWYPPMFESWDNFKFTQSGEFYEKAVKGEVNSK